MSKTFQVSAEQIASMLSNSDLLAELGKRLGPQQDLTWGNEVQIGNRLPSGRKRRRFLTPSQITEVKELLRQGTNHKVIAEKFDVSYSKIRSIALKTRGHWKKGKKAKDAEEASLEG